jgi:hypothetical protein
MDRTSCAIVIPFHKGDLSNNELACLNSLLENYKLEFPIYLLLPNSVLISKNLNEIIDKSLLKVKYTEANAFSNYYNYNVFLTSKNFYELYLNYEFVLIYQLDVLSNKSNNLNFFLNLNFDYIGPIIYHVNPDNSHSVIKVGGNGGISLRKVQSHYNITKKVFFFNLHEYYKITGYKCTFSSNPFKYFFKKILSRFIVVFYFRKIRFKYIQEDVFWSCLVPNKYKSFSISNNHISAQFGFDMFPKYSYELNNRKLPLFFHAIEKNNDGFYDSTEFKSLST